MIYKICNNERAVLVTRETVIIDGVLEVEFDGIEDGYTAIFAIGDKLYYRPIAAGKCEIDAKAFVTGAVRVTVIKNDAVSPRYICDELYAAVFGDSVAVSGNMLEYDKLLAEQRCEIDGLRQQMTAFEAELKHFREEFERIYAGYAIL